MKRSNILLLSLLSLFCGLTVNARTVSIPADQMAIINGTQQYFNGVCFTDETSFEGMSFRVVNAGEIVEHYKIIGGIIYLKSNSSKRLGNVGESGTFNMNSEEPFKGLEGEQVNVEIKVLNESTGESKSFNFYFYANATPEAFLGTTKSGDVLNGVSELSGGITVKYLGVNNNLDFKVLTGTVAVEGKKYVGEVLKGGALDKDAKRLLANATGSKVTIFITYKDDGGLSKRTALVFDVK